MSVAVATVVGTALKNLNVYAAGEPVKPADAADVLHELNLILDDWAAETRASWAETFTIVTTTGVNPETIGPTGTWVTPVRPVNLDAVAYDIGGGIWGPIPVTNDPDWWAAQQPLTSSGIPSGAYYQASEPNGAVYFVRPLASGVNVRLMQRTTIGPVLLTDALVLPQGYESALTLTLTEAIAEPFHATVSATLATRAGKARARVFGNNLRVPSLTTQGLGLPGQRGGRWDYRTGTIR